MIYNHYAKIAGLHCSKHPEFRIGQLMSNFEQWLKNKYGIDIFYLENVRFVPLLEEYLQGGGWALADYCDKRKSTDLTRFNYCPRCGKKIDWKAIKGGADG